MSRDKDNGGDCYNRVLRGGSWEDNPWKLRSANRQRYVYYDKDNGIGFRLARTLRPREKP